MQLKEHQFLIHFWNFMSKSSFSPAFTISSDSKLKSSGLISGAKVSPSSIFESMIVLYMTLDSSINIE